MTASQSLIISSSGGAANPVAVFQSETQAVMARALPARTFSFMYVLSGMLLLSVLLMAVVSLDRVVEGGGKIVPLDGSLFVQPLDRSIIREIKVREGQVVRKGQVLATMDPTFAKANLDQYELRGVANRAMVERLQAEVDGRAYTPSKQDADSELQMSIYNQRQAELRQSLTEFDARIMALRTSEARASTNASNYDQQLTIATRIKDMRSELEAKGFGSKLNTMIATSDRTSVQRQMQESQHEAAQIRSEIAALRAQRDAYVSKWRNDAGLQLATARRQLNDDKGEATKARKFSDYITLVAPEDGVVLDIGEASIGSIVDPGQSQKPLFTITPIRGRLEAEIAVQSKDIGFIERGQKVTIKLDAYDFLRHGTAQGVITSVSEGSFTQDSDGRQTAPYFKVLVRIDKPSLTNVPADFRLIPGMTLTGDILIGKRTILSYFLSGAQRASSEAMREPQ
ncbi:MAG: HlyD family type I secretion periplasmic adaptor subunit [Sphingobium sp.]|nr:HlyD family type I secretion periplasmic adaptor subunit [Sphingobium sp.]MBP6111438.1 HlyD family type I secretion periplasmic adaptor subunit [Sphingobium sp.]MBP8672372.1 HlyD family type I secretion periplasmic adaptor subunit [Sphingobium sp.]MBP9157345.1 HlyD family type I secretion periplasmic adaptor subunit [Sphingobium sp.]